MTPKPLDQIGFGWDDHKSALSWLGLLFRQPSLFEEKLESTASEIKLRVGILLFTHAVIYILAIGVIGRWGAVVIMEQFVIKISELFANGIPAQVVSLAIGMCSGLIIGVLIGCAVGVIEGLTSGVTFGLVWGMVMSAAGGVTLGIIGVISDKIENISIGYATTALAMCGLCWGVAFTINIETTLRRAGVRGYRNFGDMLIEITIEIAWGIFFAAATGYIFGIIFPDGMGSIFGIAFGITTTTLSLRFFYLPVFIWFAWPKPRGHLYSLHPVAWDGLCLLPFPAFSRLLVSYSQQDLSACEYEIERLINSYPTQRKAALRARTILLIRTAAATSDLSKIYKLLSHLPVGKNGYLAQVPIAKMVILEINQIQENINATSLQALREPKVRMLRERIENLHSQAAGFHEPLRSEFRKAITNWIAIAQQQEFYIRIVGEKEAVTQVFRAGDPADRSREAFVPRYAVIEALEKQILLATGCPGIVLYGRRRMGKSTILGNLKGFLPDTVVPVFISMQDPQAFTSLADFIRHSLQKIAEAWPTAILGELPTADLPVFMRTLAFYNARLQDSGKRVLLAIDEYENLDRKLGEKVFPEDLLATIRESIQKHRNITWLFSGSHDITELKHAEWPSYLVSTRTIEVPMFTLEETRSLLTEPLKFALEQKDEPNRQNFEPSFWGEGGIERIQQEAGGWPHLVQLIAETIVDVINDTDQRHVDNEIFDTALNKAVVSGNSVFHQLLRGECTLPGEWEYLSAFRGRETQSLPGEEAIYVSLRRRLLMEEANGEWRLRVPLMARWLKQRG